MEDRQHSEEVQKLIEDTTELVQALAQLNKYFVDIGEASFRELSMHLQLLLAIVFGMNNTVAYDLIEVGMFETLDDFEERKEAHVLECKKINEMLGKEVL